MNTLSVFREPRKLLISTGPPFEKESDVIQIIIRTRINIARQEQNLPVELEIRRTVVKIMASSSKKNFLKKFPSGIFKQILILYVLLFGILIVIHEEPFKKKNTAILAAYKNE